ncbi:MAG TPA: hypothetical protein VEI04_06015 [Syntrophobacteria bacterium]|nr:hypothetical protein [Syntrophobacteria bacterium]
MTDPGEKEAPAEEERRLGRQQEIQRMPLPEKIKLAMTGDKEARGILIKDASKQVQEAVLENQRLTDHEVVAIATSRMTPEEILRKIADNRNWVKYYQVRLGLVNNPKTPLPISLKLVDTLMLADLKRLGKSKGVPNVISSAATRLALKKAQK